jgi:hypothetical protein
MNQECPWPGLGPQPKAQILCSMDEAGQVLTVKKRVRLMG